MIGKNTHIVDCRETRGIGEGGGIAQRGTYAQCGDELLAVAMSPGRRHITKPVCEITFALRESNIQTSTLVLNAGSGVPKDTPSGGGQGLFGVTPKEISQMSRHNIVLFHFGGVKNHIIYKAKHALKHINKPVIIIAQYPLDFEDFAKIGVNTVAVKPEKSETQGTIVELITDVIRGESCTQEKLDEIINKYDSSASCKIVNDTQYEIKSTVLDETTSSELLNEIEETFELDDTALVEQNQIGGAVGKELTRKSLIAAGVACIAMLVYIAIRFQLAFGVAAIIALLHDVLITLTVYLVFDINVNTPFIAAMLTIVGYSINDTIVVFDRIRENAKGMRRSSYTEIADKSINQTLSRSINTSLTTLIIIGAVNIFVPSVREFTFPLFIGIAVGAYSSIFIASPLWVLIKEKKNKHNTAKVA